MFYRVTGWEEIHFLAVAIEKYMCIFMTLFPSKDGI